jgi:bacterioferritin
MGEFTRKIIKFDVKVLIDELNKALADEYLAAYQYWIGSKVIQGQFSNEIKQELVQHSKDEYDHAEMIANRIIQLDGVPILNPHDWFRHSRCGFLEPKNFKDIEILKQNIKGERCAISIYDKLLREIHGKDNITYHIISKILEDEVEHECDLEEILRNMKK